MNLAEGLGLYGAGLSTILAVFRVIEFWRSRKRLCVQVRGAILGTDPPTEAFEVVATNVGGQPVTITSWGLCAKAGVYWDPRPIHVSHDLPVRLEVGSMFSVIGSLEKARRAGVDPFSARGFVVDSARNRFYSKPARKASPMGSMAHARWPLSASVATRRGRSRSTWAPTSTNTPGESGTG